MWFKKARASGPEQKIRVVGKLPASVFRTQQNAALRQLCVPLNPSRVLNVGARPDSRDKEGQQYADYFPEAEFFTLDQKPVDHPNHITADLLNLAGLEECFDLIVMMSVLEHVRNPFVAAQEVQKLMANRCHLFLALPWFYPVHEEELYGDHWRFSASSVPILFDYLEEVERIDFPSVIREVEDRDRYWNDENATNTGFAMLLRRR